MGPFSSEVGRGDPFHLECKDRDIDGHVFGKMAGALKTTVIELRLACLVSNKSSCRYLFHLNASQGHKSLLGMGNSWTKNTSR